ncbi:MAG TPA: LamG-like jellyroll fold domain-containing protein [Candidatus Sulfotelmatobacter sp.]|nr:LamG-like jellyroll fold domain-containing protein [Candidatus Sulfotelmatobacter sp.]
MPDDARRHAAAIASAVPGSTYDAAVLALGPYAYYRLDETSGTVAYDASGNNLNGTYEGTAGTNYLLAENPVAPGLPWSVKTTSSALSAPRIALAWMPLGMSGGTWESDFTVAAWVLPGATAQTASFVEVNDFWLGESGTTPVMQDYPSATVTAPSATFSDGGIHFVAMTVHNGGSGCLDQLYVDGALAGSTQETSCGTGVIRYANSNAGVSGRVSYQAGYDPLAGEIGGVAIFASALTASQIAGLYGAGPPTPTPTPTPAPTPPAGIGYDAAVQFLQPYAYYRLDETTGTIAYDSSGNGRNGTYKGKSGTNYLLGQTSIVPGLSDSFESFAALPSPAAPRVALPTMPLAKQSSGAWASDFSVALWAKPNGAQIAEFGEINDYYIGVWKNGSTAGTQPFIGLYPTNNWTSTATTFADGNAHFIAETVHYTGAAGCQMYLYVDGVQTLSELEPCGGSNDIMYASDASISGRVSYSAGGAGLAGEIGGYAIFASALTAAQVAALYQPTAPGTPIPAPTPTASPSPTPAPPGPLNVTMLGQTWNVVAGSPVTQSVNLDVTAQIAPLGTINADESNGTFTILGNTCYLPGTADNGYGTGPAYMPIEYFTPGVNPPYQAAQWDIDALGDANAGGALSCEFQLQGSGGELFTMVGTY